MIELRRLYVIACFHVLLSVAASYAQQLIGTQGLLNTPTADMYPTGTFKGGVSYMDKSLLTEHYGFNTGIYYVDFTPFNWMEITFRETLLKTSKTVNGKQKRGYYQQDRSTSLRLRPIKESERRWWPSVAVGCNDIYSDHGDSYYTSVYGVLTKHVFLRTVGTLGVSAGYAHPFRKGVVYDGFFGGLDFCPGFYKDMKFMAEYDTQGVNVGAQVMLFRHLNVFIMTREFDKLGAGISYQYTIKY